MLPARGHRENATRQWYRAPASAARSAAQLHSRSAMAEATAHANQCTFARSARRVRRAVPPCCNAVLAQSMRAQQASNALARANDHTHLPLFKRPAQPSLRLVGHHPLGDADDETSRHKTLRRVASLSARAWAKSAGWSCREATALRHGNLQPAGCSGSTQTAACRPPPRH